MPVKLVGGAKLLSTTHAGGMALLVMLLSHRFASLVDFISRNRAITAATISTSPALRHSLMACCRHSREGSAASQRARHPQQSQAKTQSGTS
jgi:hypothetical protein